MVYAAESGNVIALGPFSYHFDINHRIGGNRTALMISAAHGRFAAVKSLIDDGADPRMRDSDDYTAANIASDAGHKVVASLLNHHSTPHWKLIKAIESSVEELRRDSASRELDEYESLLETKTFQSLRSLRVDCPLEPDELIWFRATENCSIGLDNSGSLVWMFDQMRVPPRVVED